MSLNFLYICPHFVSRTSLLGPENCSAPGAFIRINMVITRKNIHHIYSNKRPSGDAIFTRLKDIFKLNFVKISEILVSLGAFFAQKSERAFIREGE